MSFSTSQMEETQQLGPLRFRGRPALRTGPKKPPNKFRNVHVSFKMKQSVIDSFDEVGMAATLAKHFPQLTGTRLNTTRKKVYGWLKNRAHIRVKASNRRTSHHLCSRDLGMATTLPREYEEQLARWVDSMRQDGVPVTPQMIQIMALETAIDAGLDEASFAASWSWLRGFKRRFKLSWRARTRSGQDTQGDGDAALAKFSARVADLIREHSIDVIYNADQTGVNYEYLPTKTLNVRGDHTVWIKCGGKTKDRATAMVMADTTGKKHPLFLVLKTAASTIKAVVQENLTQRHGFGKQVWRDVEPLQDRFGCRIYGNPTAWWNSTISMDFLRYHFAGRPDRATKKVLLLWDDFSAHFTDEVVAVATELNVVLEKIPPRFTWICQPADVAWMRPMKAQLRKMWIDSIRRQVQNSKAQKTTFKLQAPKRPTLVRWITDSWTGLPESIIMNGFGKCKLVSQFTETVESEEEFVSPEMLSDLVSVSAVDETIDPTDDIENSVELL
ncbi:hypothetical protein DYB25_008018 [Aphanomyces astaci]|uniref:HTH CENPB-type domain-containing protein n=1 Tax=Aphanomyces astaci TaxID=112090 RepID=A0A397B087_APHAT|nr:hypothetical protein DYB25_008018 [Aphanomyces astaci]RHY42048.1 hypothetical protein DYB30_014211 [Aphanomyces astaci]RHY52383.1 hypothetical protein DYB38_002638 [Aphanomyces astaci]RHY76887.1 hypothetical protein DYB34_014262 [Aphanomyces astaci]